MVPLKLGCSFLGFETFVLSEVLPGSMSSQREIPVDLNLTAQTNVPVMFN
jgi:hypothetical protein